MTFSVSSHNLRPLIGGALLLSCLLGLVAIGSQPVDGQKANTPVKSVKGVPSAPQTAANSANVEFFEKSVRPILAANCYTCHAKTNEMAQGGMQLDSLEGLLKGGQAGTGSGSGRCREEPDPPCDLLSGQWFEDASEGQTERR